MYYCTESFSSTQINDQALIKIERALVDINITCSNMRFSCGAIFWTINNSGDHGVVLGLEGKSWLPFKGGPNEGETHEAAACREIFEETAGLVVVDPDDIKLEHQFTTHRKSYKIALIRIPFDILPHFRIARELADCEDMQEKRQMSFFKLATCRRKIHPLSFMSVDFYSEQIIQLAHDERTRPAPMCDGVKVKTIEKMRRAVEHNIRVLKCAAKRKRIKQEKKIASEKAEAEAALIAARLAKARIEFQRKVRARAVAFPAMASLIDSLRLDRVNVPLLMKIGSVAQDNELYFAT